MNTRDIETKRVVIRQLLNNNSVPPLTRELLLRVAHNELAQLLQEAK